MNGELLPIWPRTWKEVWLRLANSKSAPDDLFIELVSGLAKIPKQPIAPAPPSPEAFSANGELVDPVALQARSDYAEAMLRYSDYRNRYETALNSEEEARAFFRILLGHVSNEAEAVQFLEAAYGVLVSHGDVGLVHRFSLIVNEFLLGFSLRYELRQQFSLHATIPGVFSKLISEVKKIALADVHLNGLLSEFEESFADLKSNRTQARMKTCLQKQFNLLEALGSNCPNVTGTTLGAICNQLDFPHATIKAVGEKLYGFGSNYPGVRHAGNASSALRDLDMRDFVSLSLMLASFTPYVTHGLDSDRCYSG
jgi:hypothetical protein